MRLPEGSLQPVLLEYATRTPTDAPLGALRGCDHMSSPLPTRAKALSRDSSPSSVTASLPAADRTVNVLIVGGGPHALALLSALHERSFAFPQFRSDAEFHKRIGFNSLQKTGTGAHNVASTHNVCCVTKPARTLRMRSVHSRSGQAVP